MAALRVAVVGGGIVGLAVARELLHSIDGARVTVFEKESGVARHQTGHNSGVVHAGLYYAPGSLKARLCRRGVHLLREYLAQKDIRYSECGKIVVAHTAGDAARLAGIHERALANGVPGVRLVDAGEITDIEPHARGISALHSPSTAIVDYPAVAEALAVDIADAGGEVLCDHGVIGMRRHGTEVVVTTAATSGAFDVVVTCAGLQSDRVARMFGDSSSPRIVPFFGDYFLLHEAKSDMVNGLIYPVPDPRYPFLGVHLTKHVDGRVSLGPNAFLAPGREAYTRGGWSARDVAAAVGFPGFWRFAVRNTAAAVREARTVMSRAAFVREAQKYVPDVSVDDVVRGPRGIRAQAMNADGTLEDDFVITGTDKVIHLRNAPSPGATSSLAIAEYIVGTVVPARLGA
ncbi:MULTISPECIES: L-2-hydroxyglutarate oxidase [Mycolicibacterium]|uniref:FAD dependent oxidoreductase n=1 Tax=Mycolicibacterium vanbaalenii (strain DSM 7251 / JCM 13017 / BCRC 16820 / KCTC 9966 / NRRL B-24157 / PYR-1) TaxID=350058 RepID=A1T1K4_MYCVP|nr:MULTISPECIES: L-2-hydroxyglutarate oxidase [Mycolicibacterium]ABM11054.1 FAD dependent oxidoreductase [Mycolicibacterium vanbaalenii PYR-1]MCV7130038.1 L-2-hydroxyglutarate oxidase [Mycolicibacterium vanbaalenii PYR-1]QZY46521.1 L-2-hydroxyglutarate oxidase [Mycolicibacterium austroafricanum]